VSGALPGQPDSSEENAREQLSHALFSDQNDTEEDIHRILLAAVHGQVALDRAKKQKRLKKQARKLGLAVQLSAGSEDVEESRPACRRSPALRREPFKQRPAIITAEEWEQATPQKARLRTGKLTAAGLIAALIAVVVVAAVGWAWGLLAAVIAGPLIALSEKRIPARPDRRRGVALDAPRRARRHAAQLAEHDCDMFATRTIANGENVDLELLRYRPVTGSHPDRPLGATESLRGDRRWQVSVVDVEQLPAGMTADERAVRLLAMEERACSAERNAVAQAWQAKDVEMAEQARKLQEQTEAEQRAVEARGIADGMSDWRGEQR